MDDSCLILLKNRNFSAHENNSHFLRGRDKIPIPIAVDQYKNCSGRPNFSEFWSSRSFRNSQIATDCSVLTDSVLFALCAYFDGSMVFFDEFLP